MEKKVYCPIMLIAFDAPKSGNYDPRTCQKDCAWYNKNTGRCIMKDINENLTIISESCEPFAGFYDDPLFNEET